MSLSYCCSIAGLMNQSCFDHSYTYLPFVFKETFSKGNKTTNSLHMVAVTLVLLQSQTTIFPNVTAESVFHVYEYNNESTKVQFSVKVLCFANLSIQISPSCPQTLHCWEAFAEILLKTSQFTDRDTVLVEVCYSAPSRNAHRHLFEKFFEPLPNIIKIACCEDRTQLTQCVTVNSALL